MIEIEPQSVWRHIALDYFVRVLVVQVIPAKVWYQRTDGTGSRFSTNANEFKRAYRLHTPAPEVQA